jgi:cytochrome b
MIRVWDPLVRSFHWLLALSFAIAWLSAESWESLHRYAGYAAGLLVLFRVAWGFVGGRYARFAQFVAPPSGVIAHLKAIAVGKELRFVGHNPAGGAMIVTLLTGLATATFSGWLLTTDEFWGSPSAQLIHSAIAHGLLILVLLHLVGVALACLRHRENLVRAMIDGRKRAPASDDVD